MSGAPPDRVGTARRLAAHGITPDTALGQHFLLDENLADLAVREARLDADAVALEFGAGVGTLTAPLADAAGAVHAVEIDRRLLPVLEEVLAGRPNVRLHLGDAMRLDLEGLDPPPTHVVANLPYHVATPLLVETICRLPGVRRWVVMTQREVADRWLAPPGSRRYGAPSAIVQLATRADFRRPVGREVFQPRPRVDSALVGLTRVAGAPSPPVRALVRAAFAARRKTLANALAAAGGDRRAVVAALERLGRPAAARAEDLAPAELAALAAAIGWPA